MLSWAAGKRARARALAAAGGGLAAALVALLLFASPSGAVRPVTCANLQTEIGHAEPGDVLQLPAGTCEVNLTVSTNVEFTLEGSFPGTTLKPPSGSASTPIIKSTEGNVAFTLSDLVFTGMSGGSAIEISDPGEHVTIADDAFVGNSGVEGAAVDIYSSAATATKPTVLHGDTFGAPGAGNSAICCGGAVSFASAAALEVTDNTFVGNSATNSDGYGGGLAIAFVRPTTATSQVTIAGNTFGGSAPGAGNTAHYTGGGAFVELAHGQKLNVEGNSFIGNAISGEKTAAESRTGAGLAISRQYGDPGFQVSQAHNLFSGNVIDETEASGHPGLAAAGAGEWVYGVSVHSSADRFEANQITVNDGAPPEGGGLGVLGTPKQGEAPAEGGAFTGADDLFRSNSVASDGWGGAIYTGIPLDYCKSECPGSSVALQDSTVVGNRVESGSLSEGGALWGSEKDKLSLANSIVYGNSPTPQIFGFGGGASFAYSDVCNEAGGAPVSGEGLICANPLLGEAGEETSGSPTVVKGSTALVPEGLSTDLAGNPRLTEQGCALPPLVDMGAFELLRVLPASCPAPVTTTTSTSSSTTSSSTTTTTSRTPASTSGTPSVRSVKSSAGGVEVTLSCAGTASQVCEGEGSLHTTEHMHGKKLASLSRKRKRSRSVTVLIGSAHYKLLPGHTLKLRVPLNRRGKALLRRFHHLPARLVVSLKTASGKTTVLSRKLVIRQAGRGKHRGRKHKA